jgi:hypothetical protein
MPAPFLLSVILSEATEGSGLVGKEFTRPNVDGAAQLRFFGFDSVEPSE